MARIYSVADGNGYVEQLEAGTTKAEAEAVLAALPDGWTLTSEVVAGAPRAKPKSTYRQRTKLRTGHGYWPTTAAVPREEALVRVLPTENRVRMDYAPVVTYDLDPTNRPVSK